MYPNRTTILLALFLAIILGIIFFHQTRLNEKQLRHNEQVLAELEGVRIELFANLEIEAKSALIVNVDSQEIIYDKSSFRSMPLASLAKLMTAYMSQKYLGADNLVEILESDIDAVGDTKLIVGDKWELAKILSFALVNSSNDAISAITRNMASYFGSEEALLKQMNQEAELLGLHSMNFYNTTGLDINSNTNGAYGSARDTASLLYILLNLYSASLDATRGSEEIFESLTEKEYASINTNPFTLELSPLLASKTGYTALAGGNLTIAREVYGERIIFVVLGSSFEGRFKDMIALSAATDEYMQKKTLLNLQFSK